MISSLNDIKKGLNIVRNGEPYVVVEANFIQMQSCKPTMYTKMKNLLNGKMITNSFHPGEKLEEADLLRKKVDYLYNDGEKYYFMSSDDFEQFDLSQETIGENTKYFKEGDKVDALYFNGLPVAVSLPPKVKIKVVSAPVGEKGNTAQGRVTKPVELETGATIQAPLFIKEGDVIVINTETGEYCERAS